MCGLFGFSDYGHKINTSQINDLIGALANESAIRGTDATGIAYNIDGKLEIEKEAKSAYQMTFKLPKGTRAVIGHTRHSTQGTFKKKYNNHPWRGRLKNGNAFALAHNGVIINDTALRKKHNLPNTKVETDSYVALQLLEQNDELTFENIAKMAEELTGSYTFNILDDSCNTYLIKGDSPLSVIHLTSIDIYVYASTDHILWRVVTDSLLPELKSGFEEVKIDQGEILRISPDGTIARGTFECLSDCYSFGNMCNWWDYSCSRVHVSARCAEDDYLDDLKSLAGLFGYSSDDIEYMRFSGYSTEEIEEMFYSQENK